MLKFIHAADFHLDSAFGALSARQAASRRAELRETVDRLSDYVNKNGVELVLLAGDLFDSGSAYTETGERLAAALGRMRARVFVAPGNHDWYGPGSPWETVVWPENVHVFRDNRLTAVEMGNVVIHGAAFTGAEQSAGFLNGFTAPEDGRIHIGLLHGEIDPAEKRYNPVRKDEAAASGLAYLALGHTHKRMEPQRWGKTLCAWPGCLEGRGFDELGEKGFYEGSIGDDGVTALRFVPFSWRRYERMEINVTGQDPRRAVEAALPEDTARHLYRLILTGETGEGGVDAAALQEALADRFYGLEIRDRTVMAEDIWRRAEEDSLRGLFLRKLREKWNNAKTEEEREQVTRAVRFGLAALDHRDMG
jgi:DNA repair exonuclease SbcCD nuclease subunit